MEVNGDNKNSDTGDQIGSNDPTHFVDPSAYFSFSSERPRTPPSNSGGDLEQRGSISEISAELRRKLRTGRQFVASAAGLSDERYLPPLATLLEPPKAPPPHAYNLGAIANFRRAIFGRTAATTETAEVVKRKAD